MALLNPSGSERGSLLLKNVTIVDTRSGKLLPGAHVLVKSGKISSIRTGDEAGTTSGGRTIDGTGRFLVPGYMDMHVHSMEQKDPRDNSAVLLAYGVTGVRQMAGTPTLLRKREQGQLNFGLAAPELLAMPGSILTGGNAATPEQAVAEVKLQKSQGANFIKTISVTPKTFFASLAEAKAQGMKYGGHLSPGVDLEKASYAGLGFIEHLGGPFEMTLIQCSKVSWMIHAMMAIKPPQPIKLNENDMSSVTGQLIVANPILFRLKMEPKSLEQSKKLMGSFSEDKCKRLAAVFARNETWQCPTMIRSETMRFADDPRFTEAAETRYLPAEVRAMYTEFSRQYHELLKPSDRDILQRQKELAAHVLRIFNDAGVPLMAGSDYGGGWVVPGFSLHQEFDLLEQAGLKPLRVLQMTTLDAARFLNRDASLGTVEEGKDANLVLLAGDPTVSVQNLHRIDSVVRGGRYYDSYELAEMRETVASKYAA
jgi:hypothetical protein